MRRFSTAPALLVATFLALHAAPAPAQPAPDHLERAKRHYDLQEYDQAIAELREAYRKSGQAEILYAIAQAQRQKGDCRAAISSYESYLRTDPAEEQAGLARDHIDACRDALAENPGDETGALGEPEAQEEPEPKEPEPKEPEPKEPALASAPEPAPPAPRRRSFVRNWPAHAFLLSGLAAAAGGTVLAVRANDRIRDRNDAATYEDFVRGDPTADERRRKIGFALIGGGGALALTATVLYLVGGSEESSPPPVTFGPRGEIFLAGQF